MASLKDLRDRIDSVKSTKKITSAMKLVAGARLKRAQTAAESSRPYALRMQEVVDNITDSIKNPESFPDIVKGKETDKVHLIVLMTSDRGLCGGFNSSLAKLAKKKIAELSNLNKTIKILCIGRKGHDQLKRDFLNLIIDTIFCLLIQKLILNLLKGFLLKLLVCMKMVNLILLVLFILYLNHH